MLNAVDVPLAEGLFQRSPGQRPEVSRSRVRRLANGHS